MRKTMFAAKVFGLVIMFPLIAVLEINHVQAVATVNNTALDGTAQPSHTMAGMSEKSAVTPVYDTYGPAPESILLKSSY